MSAERHRFRVEPEHAGLRLDQYLAAVVPGLSRRRARVLLDIGGVFVDRARVKVAGRMVRPGQTVEVVLGGAFDRATKKVGRAARRADAAELPPFRVLFEDDDLVVVDKPAGLLTAPTPESDRGNLADELRRRPDAAPADGEPGLHVVHRIDLETSGVLVFAKSDAANRVLGEAFRRHDVEREYWVAVAGRWPDALTTLTGPVQGKAATTHVEVAERFADAATVLRARLETGRTHQIRVHCADAGHPVLADRRYGTPTAIDPPRTALHARTLGFAHPVSGAAQRFESELPADLSAWLAARRAA